MNIKGQLLPKILPKLTFEESSESNLLVGRAPSEHRQSAV